MPLPDDVAIYIAGRIKSNIRELEGSLIRLIAYASLTGPRDLAARWRRRCCANVLEHDERAVTIEIIQKFVADYYQLKLTELKSRNNSKSVAMPRQVAMYLCKSLTNASLPEIGRSFGGKHHSTVIHSIRKVEDLRKKDADFNSLINNLHRSRFASLSGSHRFSTGAHRQPPVDNLWMPERPISPRDRAQQSRRIRPQDRPQRKLLISNRLIDTFIGYQQPLFSCYNSLFF